MERDQLPLRDGSALFPATSEFTVMIKNSVNFELFNERRRNIENTVSDQTYLRTCRYHPTKDPRCPIFRLGDIVRFAGSQYDEIAKLGASPSGLPVRRCQTAMQTFQTSASFLVLPRLLQAA